MLLARQHVCCCQHGHKLHAPAPRLRLFDPLRNHRRLKAGAGADSGNNDVVATSSNESTLEAEMRTSMDESSSRFCIIENGDALKDFENLQLDELRNNVTARRNKIFLLMEELRRLRIQLRLKGGEVAKMEDFEQTEQYLSALPFLPPLTEKTLNNYYLFYVLFFAGIIAFGGLLAPIAELKLGLGGTSYSEFIQSVHLPAQLAYVDPIVASFCGGAVGVLSALLVVELNNVKKQQKNRCHYCAGTGYLMCGNCIGSGVDPMAVVTKVSSGSSNKRNSSCNCGFCAGTGKVMCTGCLCTGKQMATEHDPRIDPFD